jgi:hypothetical protein
LQSLRRPITLNAGLGLAFELNGGTVLDPRRPAVAS